MTTTATTPRRLSAKQVATATAAIDSQIAALRAVEATFAATFTGVVLADEICDAWNGTHDAIRALSQHRADVVANRRPITGAEAGTWALIQQNID